MGFQVYSWMYVQQQGSTTFKSVSRAGRENRANVRPGVSVRGVARACLPPPTLCSWKIIPLTSSLAVMIVEAPGEPFPLPLQAYRTCVFVPKSSLSRSRCEDCAGLSIWSWQGNAATLIQQPHAIKKRTYPLPGRLSVHSAYQHIMTSVAM